MQLRTKRYVNKLTYTNIGIKEGRSLRGVPHISVRIPSGGYGRLISEHVRTNTFPNGRRHSLRIDIGLEWRGGSLWRSVKFLNARMYSRYGASSRKSITLPIATRPSLWNGMEMALGINL